MAQAEYRRPPDVLTPTANLTHKEWLEFRRKGIGGSDAASVLGLSPFPTRVDLYYDKLGLPIEDSEENWVAMEVGTRLEELVARIFAKKTGLELFQMKSMLKYQGKYYTLSDKRIPYHRDKTEDERFFILTLFAIAYEIQAMDWYSPNIMRIQLAAGLPPAHYGAQQRSLVTGP